MHLPALMCVLSLHLHVCVFLQVKVYSNANMNICACPHVVCVCRCALGTPVYVHTCSNVCVCRCLHVLLLMRFSRLGNIWDPSGGCWHHTEMEYENVELCLCERLLTGSKISAFAAFEHDTSYMTQLTSRHKLSLLCYHATSIMKLSFECLGLYPRHYRSLI